MNTSEDVKAGDVIKFLMQKRDGAEKARKYRQDTAKMWRECDDEGDRDGARLATLQTGITHKPLGAAERNRQVDIETRIEAKCAEEVRLYDAAIAALSTVTPTTKEQT